MTGGGDGPEAGCTPERGSFAVDVRDGRVGRVLGRVGPYVRLRPPGGGPVWDCPRSPYGRRRRGRCCGRG